MIYQRVAIADAENGLAEWRAANEAFDDSDQESWNLAFAREPCECGQADCLACHYDHAEVGSGVSSNRTS